MAQMTVETVPCSLRRARVASRTAPPVVMTSSMRVIVLPAMSAPSAIRQVP